MSASKASLALIFGIALFFNTPEAFNLRDVRTTPLRPHNRVIDPRPPTQAFEDENNEQGFLTNVFQKPGRTHGRPALKHDDLIVAEPRIFNFDNNQGSVQQPKPRKKFLLFDEDNEDEDEYENEPQSQKNGKRGATASVYIRDPTGRFVPTVLDEEYDAQSANNAKVGPIASVYVRDPTGKFVPARLNEDEEDEFDYDNAEQSIVSKPVKFFAAPLVDYIHARKNYFSDDEILQEDLERLSSQYQKDESRFVHPKWANWQPPNHPQPRRQTLLSKKIKN